MAPEDALVGLEGRLYTLLTLDALESHAFHYGLDIVYPAGEGWATVDSELGDDGWAAWYPSESTRMPEGRANHA